MVPKNLSAIPRSAMVEFATVGATTEVVSVTKPNKSDRQRSTAQKKKWIDNINKKKKKKPCAANEDSTRKTSDGKGNAA